MIDNLLPYPDYKDSGVEWLGKIPSHWEVLPCRSVFTEVIERNQHDEELLSVTIKRGVVRQVDLLNSTSKKDASNEDKSKYKLVQPCDLVYNKMRAWQGSIGVSKYRGIVSPAYIVQRLIKPDICTSFIHYLFRTPLFACEAERLSYGIASDQWTLRASEFKGIYVPLPPLEEQKTIARSLDYADKRIRKAIQLKQKQIKLLEEYKQALIHEAVTGQIDVRTGQPYPAYKDSGVEWLGKIPSHWEVVKLKRICSKSALYGANISAHEYTTTGVRFLRTTDITPAGELKKSGVYVSKEIVKDYILQTDDLLVSRSGTVGRAFLFDKSRHGICAYAGYLVRFVPNQSLVNPSYLFQFTQTNSFSGFLTVMAISSTIENVNGEKYANCPIPLPSLEEQKTIADYIDRETSKIDRIISNARRQIELLQEYRTRLVADVVTGKVDVREIGNKLPQESADSEPLLEELAIEEEAIEEVNDED